MIFAFWPSPKKYGINNEACRYWVVVNVESQDHICKAVSKPLFLSKLLIYVSQRDVTGIGDYYRQGPTAICKLFFHIARKFNCSTSGSVIVLSQEFILVSSAINTSILEDI